MIFEETKDGLKFENSEYLIFFGNKNSTIDQLKSDFKNLAFRTIKQTHSCANIFSVENSAELEADAHWTDKTNLALCIRTADCLPIMIFDDYTKNIFSIHAGWRGVAGEICKQCLSLVSEKKNLICYIGPHIQQKSFEVDEITKNKLISTLNINENLGDYFTQSENKYFVNLCKIVQSQLICLGINKENIHFVNIDTKTNLDFHSYRRDNDQSGRQISFIYRK